MRGHKQLWKTDAPENPRFEGAKLVADVEGHDGAEQTRTLSDKNGRPVE